VKGDGRLGEGRERHATAYPDDLDALREALGIPLPMLRPNRLPDRASEARAWRYRQKLTRGER
jgi:hypothetical protein